MGFLLALPRLFSDNSNQFRLLEAKTWYKLPDHGPKMGPTWPLHGLNKSTITSSDIIVRHD